MCSTESITNPVLQAGEDNLEDEIVSLARAFLLSDGDAKVAIARAMLSMLNT